MKKQTKVFWRSVALTSVICFCLALGAAGVAKTYENTRRIGFGEYKKAVFYADGVLHILDFEIDLHRPENGES